ncbi:MAG TPA: glutamate--tRNA ligase, partial [bacterium]|nr:glutamate--tRNA ligase [bacterium]
PDLIHGDIPYDYARYDDFVIWRSDDTPVFHFTVVVDDAAMGITHVLRGDDHINNTPRQLAIFRALGVEPPRYGHIPLILGKDKAKLSKRHGETAVQAYRDLGFLPDAFVNALALFGWSDSASTQFFTRADLIAAFTPERINDTAAVFDIDKMKWLNQQHLQTLSAEQRLAAVETFLRQQPDFAMPPRERLAQALVIAGERYQLLSEAWPVIRYLFEAPRDFSEAQAAKVLRSDAARPALEAALALLGSQDDWSVPALEAALRTLPEKLGLGMGKVMQPIRVAVCGSTASPGLFESLQFLGKAEILRRLQFCRDRLA